jgi:hypothetical protein
LLVVSNVVSIFTSTLHHSHTTFREEMAVVGTRVRGGSVPGFVFSHSFKKEKICWRNQNPSTHVDIGISGGIFVSFRKVSEALKKLSKKHNIERASDMNDEGTPAEAAEEEEEAPAPRAPRRSTSFLPPPPHLPPFAPTPPPATALNSALLGTITSGGNSVPIGSALPPGQQRAAVVNFPPPHPYERPTPRRPQPTPLLYGGTGTGGGGMPWDSVEGFLHHHANVATHRHAVGPVTSLLLPLELIDEDSLVSQRQSTGTGFNPSEPYEKVKNRFQAFALSNAQLVPLTPRSRSRAARWCPRRLGSPAPRERQPPLPPLLLRRLTELPRQLLLLLLLLPLEEVFFQRT